ncbi:MULTISPECIES: DUF3089 domain-containing protein [unclassified Sphingomonas]|uniref:DUF3089 domain-containing protein n=1 Tax=unclassified Sphingomonas TaxID=196159 RepID=UPI002150C51F|nr:MULTISPECIES: DUF3089 domain-containing protein [unclassified Sphingomonas]MCR5872580.1 DUF3089 domain-containing protein [Sphingomonas sp. J344]UUX99133.1 DUF3089 domain-containing protein [Sphingomonas sp. J315]
MLTAAIAYAAAQAAAPVPADYRDTANWLCRPGREDSCTVNLDATVVAPDGSRTVEKFTPAANPKFDCFYVYPTVSTDETPNSDLSIDQAERRVAMIQAARFRSVCRVFAPMYRQVTLKALRAVMTGQPSGADPALGYADVKAAFDDYMKHDNQGRGVVLIGHSQGARMLSQLLEREFDGKPDKMKPIISAMPIGFNLDVAAGQRTGTLKTIPTCASASDTGCVVTYVSFRATVPPPAKSRFARSSTAGMQVACTNPAALGGGSASLDAYLPTGSLIGSSPAFAWSKGGAPVTTNFVKLPGMLSGACVVNDGASYFEVTLKPDPSDARTDDIPGDVMVGPQRLDDWGLHLIDMNLALGDLVKLAESQAEAWAKKK